MMKKKVSSNPSGGYPNMDFNMLPEPVRKYFDNVLSKNQEPIKSVRLSHRGFFKTSPEGRWMKITGHQVFNAKEPEFIWTGKTKLFKAVDKYENGKGHLSVKLFSLIPIVNAKGRHVDQAELLRWLGEGFWFPTNLWPRDNLTWVPIDDLRAKLTYRYNKLNVWYIVTFNRAGEITQMETQRYKDKGKLEKWVGKVSDYKTFDDIKVPTHIEAIWKLEEGDFKYVDFYVDTIEYGY